MEEKKYQRDKFCSKYKGFVPVAESKRIFDIAWAACGALKNIINLATHMAQTWIRAKERYKKNQRKSEPRKTGER